MDDTYSAQNDPELQATLERLRERERSPEYQAAQEELRREREAENREVAERLLHEWGVPGKDIRPILDARLDPTEACGAVDEFIADRKVWVLVLSGPPGTGKTTAAGKFTAHGVLEEVDRRISMESPWDPRFLEAWRLARQSAFDEQGMAKLEGCRRLAIDDLGHEYLDKGGFFLSLFDGLFNARYRNREKTLITTNLPATGFKARYGERVADRIREGGRFLELAGKSMRRRQG